MQDFRAARLAALRLLAALVYCLRRRALPAWRRENPEIKPRFAQATADRWSEIDFIPHRWLAAVRARRRTLAHLIGCACAGALLAVAVAQWQAHWLDAAAPARTIRARLAALEPARREWSQLNAQAAAASRHAAALNALDASRNHLITLFNGLGHAISTGMSVRRIQYRQGEATISGVAIDQAALAKWLDNLRAAPLFLTPQVSSVRRSPVTIQHKVSNSPAVSLAFEVTLGLAGAIAKEQEKKA